MCVPRPRPTDGPEALGIIPEPKSAVNVEVLLSVSESTLLNGKDGEVAAEADEACAAGEVERRKVRAVSVSTLGRALSKLACMAPNTVAIHSLHCQVRTAVPRGQFH